MSRLTRERWTCSQANDRRIAELMIPDGSHSRTEDWTVFYMGQNAISAVNPILDSESAVPGSGARPESSATELDAAAGEESGAQDVGAGKKADGGAGGKGQGGLLYVMSCVRTKADDSKRGATVRALGVCSPNPHIQIYKVSRQDFRDFECQRQLTAAYHAARAGRDVLAARAGGPAEDIRLAQLDPESRDADVHPDGEDLATADGTQRSLR